LLGAASCSISRKPVFSIWIFASELAVEISETKQEQNSCEGDWADLKTRGFLVVRNFLSSIEIAERESAIGLAELSAHKAFFKRIPSKTMESMCSKLEKLFPLIRSQAQIHIDSFARDASYFETDKVNIDWHIDQHVYYLHQNMYDYINFWMPIVKPNPAKSGLSLIPMDILAAKAPHVYQAILGRGAAVLRRDGGKHFIEYEKDGKKEKIDSSVAFDEMAVAPSLNAGDLLIVRGDVFHSTQDNETARIALSIRAINSKGQMTLKNLLTMSGQKYRRLLLERVTYANVLAAFLRFRNQKITVGQFETFRDEYDQKKPVSYFIGRASYLLFPTVLWFHKPRNADGAYAKDDIKYDLNFK